MKVETAKIHPNELKKEADVSLVTNDMPIRALGMAVVIGTVGILGVWSYLAPIDSAASAPGFVTVKSHSKTVQHLDGGIVKELIAKDGDIVKEGDVLLILDGTDIKAQAEILRGQQITLAAQVARLSAERDRSGSVIYPKDLQNFLGLSSFQISPQKTRLSGKYPILVYPLPRPRAQPRLLLCRLAGRPVEARR